jgi:actin-related protein
LITGGHSRVPGFGKRIESELRMINKTGTPINIVKSYDE